MCACGEGAETAPKSCFLAGCGNYEGGQEKIISSRCLGKNDRPLIKNFVCRKAVCGPGKWGRQQTNFLLDGQPRAKWRLSNWQANTGDTIPAWMDVLDTLVAKSGSHSRVSAFHTLATHVVPNQAEPLAARSGSAQPGAQQSCLRCSPYRPLQAKRLFNCHGVLLFFPYTGN